MRAVPPRQHTLCLAIVCLTTAAGCAIDLNGWNAMLLWPFPPPEETPADVGLEYEDLRIATADGKKLAAWFVPAQGGSAARATFVVHPGMAGNIGLYYATLLPWAAEEEFNIFIYDYQGFGASEGDPDYRNFEADAHAVVDYLLSRPEPSAHAIIHLGGSLGSIVALSTTAHYPDSTIGLVVYGGFFPEQLIGPWLGTYVSPLLGPMGDLAGLSWAGSIPDFMNPHLAIPHIKAPILVVVPENDTFVLPEIQINLFDALPEPKELYLSSAPHSPWAIEEDPDMGRAILQWARQLEDLLPAEP